MAADLAVIRQHRAELAAGVSQSRFTVVFKAYVHITDQADRDAAIHEQLPAFRSFTGLGDDLIARLHLVGTQDDVVASLAARVRAGADHLVIAPIADEARQLHLIAERVVPALRSALAVAPPADAHANTARYPYDSETR
jgi:hypothetical protein